MAMSTQSGGGVKAEPTVTPMIDVMLVLLIIFMIVIPSISAGFNAQPSVGVNLKQIYDARTVDKILYVKANKNLEYVKVIDALDIAAQAGVRVTGLISDQRPGTMSTVAGDNLMGAATKKEGTP